MKRIFFVIMLISLSIISANATDIPGKQNGQMSSSINNIKVQRELAFEKRLGLTEAQKIKAREIRIKGHETIKPVIDEIIAKKQEAKMVKISRIAVQVQEERLAIIDSELKVLEKRAHDLRKANMKEFESILTKEQKKILKQMKKEGRQRYHEQHPSPRPIIPNLIPSYKK